MNPAEEAQRWIVTGGGGFMGRHIAAAALARGLDVVAVDRVAAPGVQAVVDLTDRTFRGLVAQLAPAVIVHAAGPASVRDSFSDPGADFRDAVLPWLEVLEAARRLPLPPRVVLISSAAVYGEPLRLPITESDRLAPLSPYGHHKLICERLAEEYATLHEVPTLALRVFSVYGPAQRRLLPWELFQQVIGPTPEVRLLGTGQETRDYLHVEDLAESTVQVAGLTWVGPRILNMASGSVVSTHQLAETVMSAAGVRKPVHVSSSTPMGDPPHWQADVSALRRLVTSTPRSLHDGLHSCVERWLNEPGNPI